MFDETLRRGLVIQLEQLPFISLVTDERVHQMLGLMGLPTDAQLTPQIARQICERTGSSAVLEGSIAQLGDQYVLGLRAKNCRTGEVIDEDQVQKAKKEDVLNALGQIARRFRSRVGESLSTIEQHNTPLAEATTSSIEALKAYSTAWKVLMTTGSAAAVPLYQRAIEIDPQFAMAYAMLGRTYDDLGEAALSEENTSKAWQLRDRTSDWERFFVDASHDMQVTGNLVKAQQTLETWAKAYPRDIRPNSLLSGVIYQKKMGSVVSQTPRESRAEDWMAHLQSTALAYVGHLQQATEMSERAVNLARSAGQLDRAGLFRSAEAIRYALFEDKTAAIRSAESALDLSRGVDVEYGAALALAQAGNLSQAQVLVEDMERRFPENTAVKFIYAPQILALIAVQQHQPAKAIELLRTTVPYEQGEPPSSFFGFYGMFYSAYLRGQAFLAERQGPAAVVEFQQILNHRGVVISDRIGVPAHLQLGRALALSGNRAGAKTCYEEFFTIWKGSDPDIPILMQVRVDYANLE